MLFLPLLSQSAQSFNLCCFQLFLLSSWFNFSFADADFVVVSIFFFPPTPENKSQLNNRTAVSTTPFGGLHRELISRNQSLYEVELDAESMLLNLNKILSMRYPQSCQFHIYYYPTIQERVLFPTDIGLPLDPRKFLHSDLINAVFRVSSKCNINSHWSILSATMS